MTQKLSHFFAYVFRTKYIKRWSLMRSSQSENVQEHSHQVAVIAHALCTIHNEIFKGHSNPDRAAVMALFHDVSEVLTGDMPTPVKYFSSEMREAYKNIETKANLKMVQLLPSALGPAYQKILLHEAESPIETKFVKAADTLCAYIKCLEEKSLGNPEFRAAELTLVRRLKEMDLPEIQYFIENFIQSFTLTLDEMTFEL